jgi:hypothetical protein
MRSLASLAWLPLALGLAMAAPAMAETSVDLELVLAVDVSRSMDIEEQRVQREGYAAAFLHPDVAEAISSGPLGRIAVTYVEWSGPASQITVIPWTVVDGAVAARDFAGRLATGTASRDRGTSISGSLLFATAAFAANEFVSERQVVDISGDGPNNRGLPVEPVRASAIASGITINGLPIVVKSAYGPYSIPNLDVYYEDCVIGGPGAFLIPVHDIAQLALAIRRKLVLEIAGLPARVLKASGIAAAGPRIDCLIGEKLFERWRGYDNR